MILVAKAAYLEQRIFISTAHTFFAEQIDSSLISVFLDSINVYMHKVYLRETMKFAAANTR